MNLKVLILINKEVSPPSHLYVGLIVAGVFHPLTFILRYIVEIGLLNNLPNNRISAYPYLFKKVHF